MMMMMDTVYNDDFKLYPKMMNAIHKMMMNTYTTIITTIKQIIYKEVITTACSCCWFFCLTMWIHDDLIKTCVVFSLFRFCDETNSPNTEIIV